MSHTPIDPHFIQAPDFDPFGHRPHKTALLIVQAITATALFRIWPTLLFMGGWATAIVLINKKTSAELTVPATMLTVLGVVLGLTLSYRTSSAYDRYWEGRRLWSQIVLASRTWGRLVWVHCPDTMRVTPPEADNIPDKRMDEARAVIEKKTMVHMALAFAVAVKHYLRGEEGIFYEDMYDLVRFIPSLDLPSGIPTSAEANIASGPVHQRHIVRQVTTSTAISDEDKTMRPRPHLRPSREPPVFRWSEVFPVKFFVSQRQRLKVAGRAAQRRRIKEERAGGGVGHNIPMEVNLFMSSWLSAMQARKTIDVPTVNALLSALLQMGDALVSLERILTTPIPWSYNAHIWEITWIYCLLLPFQLYGAGFDWVTIPAVMITSYIVIGFAEIGGEIENPFGYDPNDLNLDFFTDDIIKRELNAITARPFPKPEEWVFSSTNTFNAAGVDANELQYMGVEHIRTVFRTELMGGSGQVRSTAGV